MLTRGAATEGRPYKRSNSWHSVCSRDDRHDTEYTESVDRAPAAYIPWAPPAAAPATFRAILQCFPPKNEPSQWWLGSPAFKSPIFSNPTIVRVLPERRNLSLWQWRFLSFCVKIPRIDLVESTSRPRPKKFFWL